jgi:hypothetical protein
MAGEAQADAPTRPVPHARVSTRQCTGLPMGRFAKDACRSRLFHHVVTRHGVRVIPPDGCEGGHAVPEHAAVAATKARARKPKRGYSKHGLIRLRAAVRELGPRVVDRRTHVGKQLAAWKADLVRDLGGDVSTQQAAVIDLAVRTKLLLDSIDAWLLVQPSLVNARKKALLPVVRERQQLADSLARYMGTLGLERKAREVPSLSQYLAERARQSGDGS